MADAPSARRSGARAALRVATLALGVFALASTPMAQGRVEKPHPVGPQRVEVGEYQALLDQYLVVERDGDRVVRTAFDYELLRGAPGDLGWRPRLDRVRRQLFAVEPSRLDPKERIAWAIDAYNFLVITRVVEELVAPDSAHTRLASVRDVPNFFSTPVITIAGRAYSLDEFERAFVFGGAPRDGLTPLADPRPHFALVCAARGCPPLSSAAYRAATLEPQLDLAVRLALASPAHLRWDPKTRTLELSSIFEWYEKDFGGRTGVMSFVRSFAPSAVRRALRQPQAVANTRTIPWDWLLNRP